MMQARAREDPNRRPPARPPACAFERRYTPPRRIRRCNRVAGGTGPPLARVEQRYESPGLRRVANLRDYHRSERSAFYGLQRFERLQRTQPVLRPPRRNRKRQDTAEQP